MKIVRENEFNAWELPPENAFVFVTWIGTLVNRIWTWKGTASNGGGERNSDSRKIKTPPPYFKIHIFQFLLKFINQ